MKKRIKKAYHFLGGAHFAVALIGAAAFFALAGTLIESKTNSHRFAAFYTYKHPAFIALLSFFFINILFAALRRWPFQLRHIPFLTTHLGLLMIISGVIIKQFLGVQGTMDILEGSGKDEILLADTYAIRIEKKGSPSSHQKGFFDLKKRTSPFKDLEIKLIGYSKNVSEQFETWEKGGCAVLTGLTPFPFHTLSERAEKIPSGKKIPLFSPPNAPWNLYALKTDAIEETIKKILVQKSAFLLKNSKGELLCQESLEKCLQGVTWEKGEAKGELFLDFSPIQGFIHPRLFVTILTEGKRYKIEISLSGANSLLNKNVFTPYLGSPPFTVDLRSSASLAFLKERQGDITVFALDPCGRIWCRPYRQDNLTTLAAYDKGFGGYAAFAEIPFSEHGEKREAKEELSFAVIKKELAEAAKTPELLAPPLHLFYQACKKQQIDFPTASLAFLKYWDKTNSWVLPNTCCLPEIAEKAVCALDWEKVPEEDRKPAFWSASFFQEISPLLQKGEPPEKILEEKRWPDPFYKEEKDPELILFHVTKKIFSIGKQLPEALPISSASAFTAYLRAFRIHLKTITPPAETLFSEKAKTTLETPITRKYRSLPPFRRLEDNTPLATLKFKEGEKTEIASFAYDKSASGLKWPILKGKYLVRFQPLTQEIPLHIRLRQARQINYADSAQPFSYESDLLITDKKTGMLDEKTISMNNVYESKDGYRLYLSGMHPSQKGAVKRAHLVVNRDPAKNFLTYPGALLVALGILLLFWFPRLGGTR